MNINVVTIHAPYLRLQDYLIENQRCTRFNMAKLFPEKFGSDDPTGFSTGTEDWAFQNTGSIWFPVIGSIGFRSIVTVLRYQTHFWPNNKTLKRLHELTGFTIVNKYEETNISHQGTFRCRNGKCVDERRYFWDWCTDCGEKRIEHGDDHMDRTCKSCRRKRDRTSKL